MFELITSKAQLIIILSWLNYPKELFTLKVIQTNIHVIYMDISLMTQGSRCQVSSTQGYNA